jgi:hypothetical protein
MTAHKPPLAYTIEEAAAACGVSVRTLNRAISRGDITRRYPTSHPVILVTELDAWLSALPVDKPVAK